MEIVLQREKDFERMERKLYGNETITDAFGRVKPNTYWNTWTRPEHEKIKEFNEYLNAFESETVSKARRVTIIQRLYLLRKNAIDIELHKINVENIGKQLIQISNSKLAPATKQGLRQALRKFLTWLEYGTKTKANIVLKGYPDVVKLIPNGIAKKDKSKVDTKDVLSREELRKMINGAKTVRDKAVISLLIESGARISELLKLRIKDLQYENAPPRFVLDINGKTGHRQIMVILYFRYLNDWIQQHPQRNEKNFSEMPLFVANGRAVNEYKPLQYGSVCDLLRRVAKTEGVTKPVNPHNFRHTWVTHKDQEGWSVSEIANAVGWSKNTRQFANYSHTTSQTSINKRLELLGVKEMKYESEHVICKNVECKSINAKNDNTCWNCKLSLETIKPKMFSNNNSEEMIKQFLQWFAKQNNFEVTPDTKFNSIRTNDYVPNSII